jgi:hypothetical protein
VAEIFPRRCDENANCAAPSSFGTPTCNTSGLCAFDNPGGCDQACPFGFACVSGLESDSCVAEEVVTANVLCSCNDSAVAESDFVVELADVAMRDANCNPSDPEDTTFQTMWTATPQDGCGFPTPSAPNTTGASCGYAASGAPGSQCTYDGDAQCSDRQMVCLNVQSPDTITCFTDLGDLGCRSEERPGATCVSVEDPVNPTHGVCEWNSSCQIDTDCAESGFTCDTQAGVCIGNPAEAVWLQNCNCLDGGVLIAQFTRNGMQPTSSCDGDAPYFDDLWQECQDLLDNAPPRTDGGVGVDECTFTSPDGMADCTYNGGGTCTDQQMICVNSTSEPITCWTGIGPGPCDTGGLRINPRCVATGVAEIGECEWDQACVVDTDCGEFGYSCDATAGTCRGIAAAQQWDQDCRCLEGGDEVGSFSNPTMQPTLSCVGDLEYATGLWEQCQYIFNTAPAFDAGPRDDGGTGQALPTLGAGCTPTFNPPVCESPSSTIICDAASSVWVREVCASGTTCGPIPCLSGSCSQAFGVCVNDGDLDVCDVYASGASLGSGRNCRGGERCMTEFVDGGFSARCTLQSPSCLTAGDFSCDADSVAQSCFPSGLGLVLDYALATDCTTLTSATCDATTATCESAVGSQCFSDVASVVQPNAGTGPAICASPLFCVDDGSGQTGTCETMVP